VENRYTSTSKTNFCNFRRWTLVEFSSVGRADDLAPGEMKMVEVGGGEVLIANLDGNFYAVSDVCTHAEASLSDGTLEGNCVECPLHGSIFDITSGEEIEGPTNGPLKCYELSLHGGNIYIRPSS